jgi:hypothetical protein
MLPKDEMQAGRLSLATSDTAYSLNEGVESTSIPTFPPSSFSPILPRATLHRPFHDEQQPLSTPRGLLGHNAQQQGDALSRRNDRSITAFSTGVML